MHLKRETREVGKPLKTHVKLQPYYQSGPISQLLASAGPRFQDASSGVASWQDGASSKFCLCVRIY